MTWILLAIVVIAVLLYPKFIRHKRQQFIQNYGFSYGVRQKMQQQHPTLSDTDIRLVEKALKDYFLMNLLAGNGRSKRKPKSQQVLAMPSKIVDDYWHQFILFTSDYQQFCLRAFGGFLHHTPAQGMPDNLVQQSIKNAWRYACGLTRMNPKSPNYLPLIFAIDTKLEVEGGNRFSLDPNAMEGNVLHIGCSGYKHSKKSSGSGDGGCGSCSSCSSCGGGCGS